jgi:flagellar biosynthesis repressor protein FlbT
MALKITLKPHEKLIISGAVVTNGSSKTDLIIENDVPVLRRKNILNLENANTPCRRIYFAIQLMYVDEKNISQHHQTYWDLVRGVVEAAPSTLPLTHRISAEILAGSFYQALKLAKKLMDYEEELITHVRSADGSVSEGSKELQYSA